MARIKKKPLLALVGGFLAILLIALVFTGGSSKNAAPAKPIRNPYVDTAEIVKIPIEPLLGTQAETGVVVLITDGFTTTLENYTLTNTYAETTVSGAKTIVNGTTTVRIGENASLDTMSTIWSVYRTTMGLSENKIISFTTDNYIPSFDVLHYYYMNPHYITFQVGKYTTPVIVIYNFGNGNNLTILLKASNIEYYNHITYTTTVSGSPETFITSIHGVYVLHDAKYAVEILSPIS